MNDVWAAIAAISSLVSAFVVVIAVLYTRSQLREAERSRSAAVALDFRARHEAEQISGVRRRLLKGGYGDMTSLSDQEADELEMLVDHYESLAMLVDLKLLDGDVARTMFAHSPSRVWELVEPWVREVRTLAPGYGRSFERFVSLTVVWERRA